MGNICGHHKRLRWNQRQIIQSWVPLLVNLFTYDNTGNIVGLNAAYFAHDFHAANDQLRTLPDLLKGRSGINRDILRKIKSLQQQTSTLLPSNTIHHPTSSLQQSSSSSPLTLQHNDTGHLDTSFLPNGQSSNQ